MWFSVGSNVIAYFLGLYEHVSLSLCEVFLAGSIGKILGAFLNVVTWRILWVLDLVLYLCALRLYTLVSVFSVFTFMVSHRDVILV